MSWPITTTRLPSGALAIGGVALQDLAREFGTPLYVFDEATLRERARFMRTTFASAWPHSRVSYAAKAYLSLTLTAILAEEGIGLDVVSGGELAAGLIAGMKPGVMTFHGNNKSEAELRQAVDAGVGAIAIDNLLEIEILSRIGQETGKQIPVMIRLNPGVDVNTNAKMRTGVLDSKFGFPLAAGDAMRAVDDAQAAGTLELIGYHAHVGSQVFDPGLVRETIELMVEFAAAVRDKHGVTPRIISPGGGFGVADDGSGNDVSIPEWAESAAAALRDGCARWNLPEPELAVEPGRSIIGPAGIAVYETGARKVIPGGRTYVSVDGGMSDNIRPSLYGARYSAVLANRTPDDRELEEVTIAGKYCESGDILIQDIELPPLLPGDLLATPMAGAYCLAMASNYNLAPRPAVVLVNNAGVRLIRKRETIADMLAMEIGFTRDEDNGAVNQRLAPVSNPL